MGRGEGWGRGRGEQGEDPTGLTHSTRFRSASFQQAGLSLSWITTNPYTDLPQTIIKFEYPCTPSNIYAKTHTDTQYSGDHGCQAQTACY